MPPTQMLRIHDVPARVVRAVNADAKRRNVSINEAVVGVIADRFNMPAELGGRFTGPIAGTSFNLRLPRELHRALKTHSATTGAPMRAVVISELQSRYGLPAKR